MIDEGSKWGVGSESWFGGGGGQNKRHVRDIESKTSEEAKTNSIVYIYRYRRDGIMVE